MAITLVNSTASGNFSTVSAGSMTVTIPAPTAGNTLALLFNGGASGLSIASIVQTGVTWVSGVTSGTLRRAEIWTAINIGSGAGTSVTINFSVSLSQAVSAEILEFAGVGAGAVTGTPGGNSGTSVTPATVTTTPTAGRNGVILASARIGGAYSSGPTSGFTGFAVDGGSRGYAAYLIESSTTGAYSTTWTAGSGNWETAILAITAPAGGGGTPGTFAARTGLVVAADPTYMTDGGTFAYRIFIPSASALAAAGWTGQPYRTLVCWAGSGENGTDNTAQVLAGGSVAQALGYSGTPSSTWPILTIFPQRPATWTGTDPSSPSAGAYGSRMHAVLETAILAAVEAEFTCDTTRRYKTGYSDGALRGFEHLYRVPNRFAAFIPIAGGITTAITVTEPGTSAASNTAAAALVVPLIKTLPTRMYNSSADATVTSAQYQPTVDAYAANGATDFTWTDTGGDHTATWPGVNSALVDPAGSALQTWLFARQRTSLTTGRKRRYARSHLLIQF
jgi:hypothetical protein